MSERYEIQEKIGQGGIGAVYRAYDTQLKRSVAIKRMLPTGQEVNGQDSAGVMFKEATTLSALQHPNIITVYDVGVDEEGPFVVMELLKGETLDQVIKRGVLTLRDFCEVVTQTMEALIAAEAAGVLHRDLKPTNVMVNWLPSRKFQVKILDFSLAKFSRAPAPQTIDQGDAIFGSIYFMAPEQFERGNLDQRTDLYSMGCLYYFCLAGQYPFQGESAAQVMASHLQGNVIPLERIRPDLPPVICQWVMWLINREARNRPQNAREAFENYNQIEESIDPQTGRVVLSGRPLATSLHTTSRRLILPPPKKTTSVTPLPAKEGTRGQGEEAGDAATAPVTSPVTAMPRKKDGIFSYLVIALVLLLLVAAGLGVSVWFQHRENERAVERFEALASQRSPVGGSTDVAMLSSYLGGSGQPAVVAREILIRLQDVPGAEGTIDAALVAALEAAGDPTVQANLIKVIHRREIRSAQDLLLEMTSREFDPEVTRNAMLALGDFGDMEAFERLLGNFHGKSYASLPVGLESALESLAKRLPNKEVAVAKIARVLESKEGSARFPLIRVLGVLGGDEALRLTADVLKRKGEDEADRNDRLAALGALGKWRRRSPEVAELVHSAWSGPERQRALLAYIALALRPGDEPSQIAMVEDVWTQLHTNEDNGELDNVRIKLLSALPDLDDRDFARTIAKQMETSPVIADGIKRQARRVYEDLQQEIRPESD